MQPNLSQDYPVGAIVELVDNAKLTDLPLGLTGVITKVYTDSIVPQYPILVDFVNETDVPVLPKEIKVIYVSGF